MREARDASIFIAVVSFIALIVIVSLKEDSRERIAIGDSFETTIETTLIGIEGHHRVRRITAMLRVSGLDPIECEAIAFNQSQWSDSISAGVVTYRSQEIETGRDPVRVFARIRVPNSSELVGKDADLRIQGIVQYPKPIAGEPSKFEDAEGAFTETKKFSLVASGASQDQHPWYVALLTWVMLGSLLVFVVTLIGSIFMKKETQIETA